MRKQTIDENRRCPKRGRTENQINGGYNRSGTQRYVCKNCNHKYTLNGKTRAYPEDVQRQAMKIYYSGVSGRATGKVLGLGKNTVLGWIKKTTEELLKSGKLLPETFEMDVVTARISREQIQAVSSP